MKFISKIETFYCNNLDRKDQNVMNKFKIQFNGPFQRQELRLIVGRQVQMTADRWQCVVDLRMERETCFNYPGRTFPSDLIVAAYIRRYEFSQYYQMYAWRQKYPFRY